MDTTSSCKTRTGTCFPNSAGGGLGSLSAKYESSGKVGTIANNSGDWGGKSYGKYQIATNTGTMNSFMSYLKNADPGLSKALSRYKVGSSGFDTMWKSIAASDPDRFEKVQHGFIQSSHYEPAMKSIKKATGFDASKYPLVVQDVLWSTAVQHGTGGATSVFKNAGIRAGMSATEIIKRVYAERSKVDRYFSRSSSAIKKSVYNRFQSELKDALARTGGR
jgi:hypothetical protein